LLKCHYKHKYNSKKGKKLRDKPNPKYNPKQVESKLYKQWGDNNYFDINSNKHLQNTNLDKTKNFAIMRPPPNVTGVLHIGHALTYTLQDIMVRYKRMDGYKVLWQVGADHAGIATQKVVLDNLAKTKNISKNDLNKEEFLKHAWKWKEYSGGEIFKQMRALGISPSWDRMRFSLDDGLANSVKKAFVSLYNEGLIYKGKRLVNWDPSLKTAISDLEVINKPQQGFLYFVKYPFVDTKNKHILIATTRPETCGGY
jgi:valyl-tRNA synthetase